MVVAFLTGYSVSNASAEAAAKAPAVLSVSLTYDSPPPVPVITMAPASSTYDTSAHFEFSDQGQFGGFQCRLDDAQFGPCGPGGVSYSDLGLGGTAFTYWPSEEGTVAPREGSVGSAVRSGSAEASRSEAMPLTFFIPEPASHSTWSSQTRSILPSRY